MSKHSIEYYMAYKAVIESKIRFFLMLGLLVVCIIAPYIYKYASRGTFYENGPFLYISWIGVLPTFIFMLLHGTEWFSRRKELNKNFSFMKSDFSRRK